MNDQERLDMLKRKRDARKGMPGFEDNVRELEREIAKLEETK